MARYTAAVCRLCRRSGEKLMLKGDKCITKCTLDKRPKPPGPQLGRRRRISDRGLQLREKQKVRHSYGMLEKQFRRFINDIAPKELLINKHVAREYGRIRAMLFEKYGPKDKKKRLRRPEQLIDPATSLQLRIQENDLWIVSQAIARDFTLVTNDRRSLKPLLEATDNELHIVNWAEERT